MKKAYMNESPRAIFKGELRMQTYIDIIKPSCLEGTFFLNICGGNKAHIVAQVSVHNVLSFVNFLDFLVSPTALAICMLPQF